MRETDPPPDDHLDAIGALAEPNRRAVYDYVVDAGEWVSRDRAADGAGLQRGVAAHHLDRLADDGLLEVDYQRQSGRSGPGAGRPAKVYRRSRREFEVALPPRDYELAGRLLADAISRAAQTGVQVRQALDEAASDEGRRLGQSMRDRLELAQPSTQTPTAVLRLLADNGFEPEEIEDGTIVLRNCPFHHLAQTHTELICGMNHSLVEAALESLGAETLGASLEPDTDTCCVRLHRR